MTLRGFLFQARMVERGSAGEMRAFEIEEYNPANKNFTSNVYQDDGGRFSGTLTVDGNTFTWAGKFIAGGKEYQFKEPLVCTADCTSGTVNGEISADGKTWAPFFEAKYTKAKPAGKK